MTGFAANHSLFFEKEVPNKLSGSKEYNSYVLTGEKKCGL